MTSPPDYEALEARVAELEHQMRNVMSVKIDAVAYGLSVMHHEMTETLAEHTEQLQRIELRLGSHDERFDAIDSMLAEILRRLPG